MTAVETARIAVPATCPMAAVLDTKAPPPSSNLAAALKKIHLDYGKSPYALGIDMLRRFFSPQALTPFDYLQMRLFDDENLTLEQKDAFLGVIMIERVARAINWNSSTHVLSDHKLISEILLRGFGYPVVRTKAIARPGPGFPGLTCLPNAAAMAAFLRCASNYPLFGKPLDELLSLGAASLVAYASETDELILLGGRRVGVEAFVDEVMRHYGKGYLLQDVLVSHPLVAERVGPVPSTVRFYTLKRAAGPEILRSVWKLPAGGNVADNFWRGNLLAALDPDTGAIRRVIKGSGLSQRELQLHPDTEMPLIGFTVPLWRETREMVLSAARAIDIDLLGWDVAITSEGGVVVEFNNAPDFRLAQMAEHRGMLGPELIEAMECGRTRKKQVADATKRGRREERQQMMAKFFHMIDPDASA